MFKFASGALAAFTIICFALPASAWQGFGVGVRDDGLPRHEDVFAGPSVGDENPLYWQGPYEPDRFEIPAWPYPDGLSPVYITDVELVGVKLSHGFRWGVENMVADIDLPTVRAGRYVAAKIMYPPELPWIYDNEPIASYGPSFMQHGTAGALARFDGVNDGALSVWHKPDGDSGYWGGGSSDGQPDTLNLFTPWWARDFWIGKPDANGQRWVPLVLEAKTNWYFYSVDGDAPMPTWHWYSWEDRIGCWMPEHPDGVRYFFDRDGVGPLAEESVFIPWPIDGLPMTFEPEPFAPAKSVERLEPDPVGAPPGRVVGG